MQTRDQGLEWQIGVWDRISQIYVDDQAWEVLASVTTAQLAPERREEAKRSVRELMWTDPVGPRTFRNTAQFLVGQRRS